MPKPQAAAFQRIEALPQGPEAPVDSSLDRLLEEFHRTNTGLLPVVEAGGSRKIVGLVEQRDLLRALHRTDAPKKGSG